jgi:predicted Zn-dependent peptidase
VSNTPIVRDVLDNGLRILTERMSQVRSISIGVWLTRGSRHETAERSGIAHFVEHMLFKGTGTRSAEDIAQAIDSIGGQLDAFTAKEYASYYIKVLDEHLPLAIDILSDIVRNPAFSPEDIEREKKVVVEEIKMVEDTPDDLVHELVRDLVAEKFGSLTEPGELMSDEAPRVVPRILVRNKELEQSHLCLGVGSYPQNHEDRYSSYVLNTLLGGSMSSRLFQNVREKRGLAYAVFSGLSAYRDAGSFTIYAGCSNEAVGEVIDLVVEELRGVKNAPVADAELQRSKDHLKGSLMLSLENTASRMSHLARQEIYFDRQFGLDETLQGIEYVTTADVQRVAADLFRNGSLSATVLGNVNGLKIPAERLNLD